MMDLLRGSGGQGWRRPVGPEAGYESRRRFLTRLEDRSGSVTISQRRTVHPTGVQFAVGDAEVTGPARAILRRADHHHVVRPDRTSARFFKDPASRGVYHTLGRDLQTSGRQVDVQVAG